MRSGIPEAARHKVRSERVGLFFVWLLLNAVTDAFRLDAFQTIAAVVVTDHDIRTILRYFFDARSAVGFFLGTNR